MSGKAAGAAVGGSVLLLLFIALAGGGSVAAADAPAGGCAVTVTSNADGANGGTSGQGRQVDADLSAEQMAIARTIIGVGKGMGIAPRGTAIALGTAMQESTLDPTTVNGRSSGLFQQQGEYYAGVDKTDAAATAAAFYRMLLDRVPSYDNPDTDNGGITFADAAQTVQASGAGAAWYARWERWAGAVTAQLYDGTTALDDARPGDDSTGAGDAVTCTVGGGSGSVQVGTRGLTVELPPESGVAAEFTFPTAAAATAAAAALSYLGTTYTWGGGGPNGPSRGTRDGGVGDRNRDYLKVGFDCSGLTQYAYAQAGIALPRVSGQQRTIGTSSSWNDAEPGDLLFWGAPVHHVALYLGESDGTHYMVEAPRSGSVVKVSTVRTGGDFVNTAVRPY